MQAARDANLHANTASILAQRANQSIHAYERIVGSMPETMSTLSNAAETLQDKINQELSDTDSKRHQPLENMIRHRAQGHHHQHRRFTGDEGFD